jgi:glycosyltransferase involved in cell wall biosynthesis
MKRVQVLLSTYNGEKHLNEQIDSLARQTQVQLQLTIRDDGSSDGTRRILSAISKYPFGDYSATLGANIGVIASFFELLDNASLDAEYYSFCDQDDVWKQDKLARAVSHLENIPSNIPVMYCSRTELVDESLNHLGYWPPLPRRGASFSNAIIENIAVGCTIVFNRAAKELLSTKIPDTSRIIMHDWWIYLCISAFGRIIYDSEPTILYRQHSSNVMGGTTGFVHKWSNKFKSFRKNSNQFLLRKQAEEFYRLFGDKLSENNRNIIDRFLNNQSSWNKRIKYFYTTELYRHSVIENCLYRLMYLFKKI